MERGEKKGRKSTATTMTGYTIFWDALRTLD